MKSTVNKLSLKWGTLKSWGFPEAKNAKKLLKEYCTIGASGSAILQHDTPRQKEIICQLIDLCDGDIYLDWEDKYVSKDEAKEYVKNYGKTMKTIMISSPLRAKQIPFGTGEPRKVYAQRRDVRSEIYFCESCRKAWQMMMDADYVEHYDDFPSLGLRRKKCGCKSK